MAFAGETAESHYDEGLTASMKGDIERAVGHFEAAIRLDNTLSPAYHQLGKCQLRLGNGAAAVDLLRRVVGKRPEQATPRLDLGLALLDIGNIAEARQQFKQVLALDVTHNKALLGLAQAAFNEGDWAGAASHAQSALATAASNFAVLFLLGRAAKLTGDVVLSKDSLDKADTLLEKYLEINPEKPEGHFLRGEVAFVGEHFAAALNHYRDAQDSAKAGRGYLAYGEKFTLADILAKQGLCLQRMGQEDRAREMGARILTIDPEHKLGKALSQTEPGNTPSSEDTP